MENNFRQGWVECSLGEILTAKKGKKPSSVITEPKVGYVPYILIDEMEGKPIRTYTNDPKVSIIDETEVLLVWDGSIGKCGSGMKGAIGSTLVGLKALDKIQTKFLEYTIRLQNNFIKETSTGSGLQHINKDFFEICKIPLPPLLEQHRIVSKLDAVMQKVENNKQRLEKIPKLLKRFRQSVLAAAVSGKLTEDWREKNGIDDEWKEKTLSECGEITGGITINSKRELLQLKMPYLRVGNVYSNEIKLDEVKNIGVLDKEVKRALLKTGDLLIVEGNGSPDQIGRVAQWKGEIENCLHQNHLIKFRQNNFSEARYLLYYLLSFQGREQIEEASKSTSGLYTLSITKVSNLNIALPPLEEQKEIVSRVEQLFALADKLEARYSKAKTMLDKLPQSILAKAFRGELVAQDPNDEPASVLLERIKKEKEKLAAEKKGKKSKEYSIEEKPLKIAAEKKVKYKKAKA